MPFFIIIPVWLLFVLAGIVLLLLPQYRRLGWYVVIVSTTATLTSFVLSTAVLYFAANAADPTMKWSGLAVIGTYVLAIAVGIAVGGIAGAILTRKLLSGGKRASTPSMRRPVGVKAVLVFLSVDPNFFTEPPLSPSFHPQSLMSDFRSLQVGRPRYSGCCDLIIDLGSVSSTKLGQELGAVT